MTLEQVMAIFSNVLDVDEHGLLTTQAMPRRTSRALRASAQGETERGT
ncbi:hypothetical protein [Micromonospora fulviviridis]|nr:hypothetical protein [Micromonospora fulviviridis]